MGLMIDNPSPCKNCNRKPNKFCKLDCLLFVRWQGKKEGIESQGQLIMREIKQFYEDWRLAQSQSHLQPQFDKKYHTSWYLPFEKCLTEWQCSEGIAL